MNLLASLPNIEERIGEDLPIATVRNPVCYAPVAVAFEAEAGYNDTLVATIDALLTQLDHAITLVIAKV